MSVVARYVGSRLDLGHVGNGTFLAEQRTFGGDVFHLAVIGCQRLSAGRQLSHGTLPLTLGRARCRSFGSVFQRPLEGLAIITADSAAEHFWIDTLHD
jgi:hypothetical protein